MKKLFFNLWYFRKPPWDTGVSPPELLAYLEAHPPGRALDLGCGTGTNVITLAKHGWQATGVDFAYRAIQKARRKARRAGVEARFLVDSVIRLARVEGPFDLILDMGCFHNLSAREKASYLQHLERLLAPGGTYLLYGFFKGEGSPATGLEEADITALADKFQLQERADGFNRGGQPSAWLTFRKEPEQTSPSFQSMSDWAIPDYIVDSPYDLERSQPRSPRLDRRLLPAIGLLALIAILLLVLGSLAYRAKDPILSLTGGGLASTEPPAASIPLSLTSPVPSPTLPLSSPSPAPRTPAAEPGSPTPDALIPSTTPSLTISPEPQVGTTASPTQSSGGVYLIHEVLPGESLAGLAEEYNTSIEVLTAANAPVEVYVTAQAALASANVELQGAVLPPGILLVILPDQTDPAGVPRCEVVYIDVETSVSALAELQSISVAELRETNDLGSSEWIPPGSYLIIPKK